MNYRLLGKTGFEISEVSLGTWQLGGKWGEPFDETTAFRILEKAISKGINFIDTADVYNNGMSEKIIGKFIKQRKEKIFVATKCGRGLKQHITEEYNEKNIREFVENSLKNMDLEVIDLLQLHCPPTEVYYKPQVFEILEKLRSEGKLLYYGVSVEKIEEAMKAIEYPGLATVQIIFNMFRQRPSELFFKEAEKRKIGIIIRVPLASGLLTGKYDQQTVFSKGDHRNYNRDGKSFDKGETFAGVNYERGLKAVEELKKLFETNDELASYALKWILMHKQVSCVIPGASNEFQIETNIKAPDLTDFTQNEMQGVVDIYEKYVKNPVHYLW